MTDNTFKQNTFPEDKPEQGYIAVPVVNSEKNAILSRAITWLSEEPLNKRVNEIIEGLTSLMDKPEQKEEPEAAGQEQEDNETKSANWRHNLRGQPTTKGQYEELQKQVEELREENEERRMTAHNIFLLYDESRKKVEQLEEALKSIRGIEAWIGDREMKELFQRKVYGVLNPQDNQKEK